MSPESRRRRRGRHAGTCLPSIKKKKRKKRVVALGPVWRKGGLWPRAALWPRPPKRTGKWEAFRTPAACRCPPPPRGGSSQDGCTDSRHSWCVLSGSEFRELVMFTFLFPVFPADAFCWSFLLVIIARYLNSFFTSIS